MKKSYEIIVRFAAGILILIFLLTVLTLTAQFLACFGAAKRLPYLTECAVMHVVVYGSSPDNGSQTVSARLSMLDTDGTEFAVIERSWQGDSLYIDFVSADFSGKTIQFPYAVHTNLRSEGTKLEPYYIERRQCLLFGMNASKRNRRDLYTLARYAHGQAKRIFTHFTRLYRIDLSQCASGTYYTVYTGFDGRLYITSD